MDAKTLADVLSKHVEWLTDSSTGQKADLQGADLQGADLRRSNLQGANLRRSNLQGANLDFSNLPLHCGGLAWKIDKRIAVQLAYHLCSMQCDDAEFLEIRDKLLPFANQMHRQDVPRLT